jgi:integrase
MSVTVKVNQHGYLAIRVRWRGRDDHIGTKLKDDGFDGRNRKLVDAKATLIAEDLHKGIPLHRALREHLGACPTKFLPASGGQAVTTRSLTVGTYYNAWIPRQVPPDVRASAARKHRQYFESVILPYWRDVPLQEIAVGDLREFRAHLAKRTVRDRPICQKTIRNIIDGHLRPLYRDAREELEEQGIHLGDPFSRLRWQKAIRAKPDPFTTAERDRVLAYFLEKKPFWHPLIYFLFYVGTRPSEAAALRIADIDLDRSTVSITKSRDEHAEAAPKTEKSRREIKLLPNVVEVLRKVQHPSDASAEAYFFRNPDGGPITTSWWPKKSWLPVLKKLEIRRRKFYATRHTFISWALTEGMNLKALGEYVGTSTAMIENSYGRFISDRGLAPLMHAVGMPAAEEVETGNLAGTFASKRPIQRRKPQVIRGLQSGPRGNRTPVCDVRGRRPNR